ncbi:amidase signature domain-containing protein [Dipodascopsis uninucleata]
MTLRTNIIKEAQACLHNVSAKNGQLNAIISMRSHESILEDVQRAVKDGISLPLGGRLIALKDNICTTEGTTTCASNMLKGYKSPYNATIVDKLIDSGAVILGKTNMDEFAMGTDNIHTIYGAPKNPLYPGADYSAGGSSGGSAVAVGSGMCYAALGTDTGGSVRLPAALCGAVGFKPSYGLISRYGVIAFAQSLDTVGILADSIRKVRTVFHAISGYDPKDPTSISQELRDSLAVQNDKLSQSAKKWKIGIPLEFNVDSLSESVKKAWKEVLQKMLLEGHELYTVSLPSVLSSLPTYYIVAPAEASSNLARYDGIRYGHRASEDRDSEDGILYGKTRSEGFGEEVRRRILLGNYNLSSGAFNNHYIQAQKVRRKIQYDFDRVFTLKNPLETKSVAQNPITVDFLVTPCSIDTAPSLDDVFSQKSPLDAYVNDVLTVPASLAGIPAVTVPWKLNGKVNNDITIGIQVMGQFGDDERVLNAGETIMNYYTAIA